MGMRQRPLLILLGCLILILVGMVPTVQALDARYLRNGEAYLLLGGGVNQGVFRLTNPAGDAIMPPGGYLYNPGTTIGLSVDLYRTLYTFSEQVDPGFTLLPGNLPRQVVDSSVTADQSDWGYHAWLHYDHRDNYGSGQRGRPIYRTGPAGRAVRGSDRGSLRYSAGPGSPISAPLGNPLPIINGVQDQIQAGKAWYEIPNGSWYSSWQYTNAVGTYNRSYKVFWDRLEGKAHNWKLCDWHDGMGGSPNIGGIVGTSYDVRNYRAILNGCLDGCGGATGTGSGASKPMYTSVAFMPPMGGGYSRTYFYSRETDNPYYTITLSTNGGTPGPYTPTALNPLIGDPTAVGSPVELGARWIGVSLRSAANDYVYVLGTAEIGRWYQQITGAAPYAGFAINAVAVSNQWNQLGGIVFAYDKARGIVYKFARNETSIAKVSAEGYEALLLGSDVDDIEADGFGSLYFAKTTTTPVGTNISMFNLDTDVFDVRITSTSGGTVFAKAICAQTWYKNVFTRDVTSGSIYSVGQKNLGSKYFANSLLIPASVASILNPPYSSFGSRLLASGGAWLGEVGAGPEYSNTYAPPAQTELAVINVPSPPQVLGFPGNTSHVDIVGPYRNPPIRSEYSTNQNVGLLSMPEYLDKSAVYLFYAENYPLDPNQLNPTIQPDYNSNGFLGGFINTITNPQSSNLGTGGRVFYRWKLWTVALPSVMEDGTQVEQVVTPAADPVPAPPVYPTPTNDGEYFPFFSPIGGKYILTLQVAYDWYNYDALPFGALFADREGPTCRKNGAYAVSAGRNALISQVKGHPKFGFMNWATMSTVLENDIIPDDTWAAIPLVATGTRNGTEPVTIYATIERCDQESQALVSSAWTSTPTTGYHGVFAGRKYGWRMAYASQTALFNDISTTNNVSLNYVANRLMDPDPKNPLYANSDPSLVFRNEVGDTIWDGAEATYDGSIIATMPDDSVFQSMIFQNFRGTAPTHYFAVATWPSDPFTYTLEIQARRRFKYKMWPKATFTDPVTHVPTTIWMRPFWLPGMLTVVARTNILAVDEAPPVLVQEDTTPRNLFGTTGDPLAVGDGPTGQANPAQISFFYRDNNPWENDPRKAAGVTRATSITNRAFNDQYDNPSHVNYHHSRFNLKPVFSRERRYTRFDHAVVNDVSTYTTGLGKVAAGDPSKYRVGQGGDAVNGYITLHPLNTPSNSSVVSDFEFRVPLTKLFFSPNSLTIPRNYANNTPGYEPYAFWSEMEDSSGNLASEAKFNLVLNVRDNIPPIPSAGLLELKEQTYRAFPLSNGLSLRADTFPFSQPVNRDASWQAGPTGLIPGTTPELRTLKTMGATIVKRFSDGDLLTQINNDITPLFMEDNVEFEMWPFVVDNAGYASCTLTVAVSNPDGTAGSLNCRYDSGKQADNSIRWPPAFDSNRQIATQASVIGIFRGMPGEFPIAFPVKLESRDNAIAWTYYTNMGGMHDQWTTSNYKLSPANPASTPNLRSVLTTIPVFETKMQVRTLEKSLRHD